MPLDIEDISEYGTNSDGTLNQEFSSCCLNSGKYLFNLSMEYLIYLWGLFPDSYNQIAGTNYKSEELRNVLSDRLPNLKRWKQKTNTAARPQARQQTCLPGGRRHRIGYAPRRPAPAARRDEPHVGAAQIPFGHDARRGHGVPPEADGNDQHQRGVPRHDEPLNNHKTH